MFLINFYKFGHTQWLQTVTRFECGQPAHPAVCYPQSPFGSMKTL